MRQPFHVFIATPVTDDKCHPLNVTCQLVELAAIGRRKHKTPVGALSHGKCVATELFRSVFVELDLNMELLISVNSCGASGHKIFFNIVAYVNVDRAAASSVTTLVCS